MLETDTTAHDVALDVVAALDMFGGLLGGESTTLKLAEPDYRDGVSRTPAILLTLSDGSVYRASFEQIA